HPSIRSRGRASGKGQSRLGGSRRRGQALHGPLRSGERDVAQRVHQRAPHSAGTKERNCSAHCDGKRAVRADPESERPDRSEETVSESGRKRTIRIMMKSPKKPKQERKQAI